MAESGSQYRSDSELDGVSKGNVSRPESQPSANEGEDGCSVCLLSVHEVVRVEIEARLALAFPQAQGADILV